MSAAVDRRHLDPSLDVEERVALLLPQLTLAEKAGLMFHSMVLPGPQGVPVPRQAVLRAARWLYLKRPGAGLAPGNRFLSVPPLEELVLRRQLTHFNVVGRIEDATAFARWQNAAQQLAKRTRLQIPLTFSTDPRHHFTQNIGTSAGAGAFSEWPEALGLAALRDPELVRGFADTVRREYLAVGLRVALHPQIDLATEPRWARIGGTFGEDVDLVSALGVAYITGLQTGRIGVDSVAAMVKHFPGGGPQRDGEDPHFAYGREQVYPSGSFEHHLAPFIAAVEAGAAQMMPYYGMPSGTEYEEVGFAFNRRVITSILRERLGFDGIVCADWGVINDTRLFGEDAPARAWGLEHASPSERVRKAIEAGVDQFGGEFTPELVVGLVERGAVSEERIDVSVHRLLREKFRLGLFDQAQVDVDAVARTVGTPAARAAGAKAQREAITVLRNQGPSGPLLPLRPELRVYAQGISGIEDYATVVSSPEQADVAIIRLRAPYEHRRGGFESRFHAGSLDFDKATIAHVRRLCGQLPTVVQVYLDRPAILTPFAEAAALVVDFGARGEAILDVLFGRARARGRLPFDLPSSMDAVLASAPDAPFDTAAPLFRFGDGLTL